MKNKFLAEMPNTKTLAKLEYQAILDVSEALGTRYLRNQIAGGAYFTRNPLQTGYLYVLVFRNCIKPDLINPKRDFKQVNILDNSRFIEHPRYKLHLPKFSDIPTDKQILKLIGYGIKNTIYEECGGREGKFKCDECEYSADSKKLVNSHKQTHADKDFKCNDCDYASNKKSQLYDHVKRIHKKTIKLPAKKRQVDFRVCEIDGCGQKFTIKTSYDRSS